MGPHPSRREPLSHCKSTAACRPNAPFSSSLEGWDVQPDGRKTPAPNPTTPSKAEGPMPKEMGKRQCQNAREASNTYKYWKERTRVVNTALFNVSDESDI